MAKTKKLFRDINDYVLTHTKKFRRVYATIKKYNTSDKVLKLVCDNGASVSLTGDHPILTHNRGWIYPRDIKIGDVVFQNFYKFTELPKVVRFTTQHILVHSHNRITSTTEKLISLKSPDTPLIIWRRVYEFFYSSLIGLKNNFVIDKKINKVAFNNSFMFTFYISAFKKINKLFKDVFSSMCTSFSYTKVSDIIKIKSTPKTSSAYFKSFSYSFNINPVFNVFFLNKLFKKFFSKLLLFQEGILLHGKRLSISSNFNPIPFTPATDTITANTKFLSYSSKRFLFTPVLFFDKLFKKFFVVIDRFFTQYKILSKNFNTASIITINNVIVKDFMYDLSVEKDETYISPIIKIIY